MGKGLNDANFDALQAACDAQDAHKAFEAAHALKGAVGNLSLTPIYTPLCALTECLRGQAAIGDDARKLVGEVFAQLKRARALM